MVFSKSFPKRSNKSVYPNWNDVFLSEDEERKVEQECREENVRLMKECLSDAGNIIMGKGFEEHQSDLVNLAVALFEKRASHVVFWKENKAKEKFFRDEEKSEQEN
ncbi:hypothetical protein JW711_02315 [Candidatus Woesearchaeota archaeon]|nr:hypothetical protein [Candidatus Woesearchaeota archaeon]